MTVPEEMYAGNAVRKTVIVAEYGGVEEAPERVTKVAARSVPSPPWSTPLEQSLMNRVPTVGRLADLHRSLTSAPVRPTLPAEVRRGRR